MPETPPSGCSWCGVGERDHAQRWGTGVGFHRWTPPSQEQIKDRMLLRRERAGRTRQGQTRLVEAWNASVVLGAPVRYWTGFREGPGKTSTTRTRAQLLSGHTAVVWVEGEGSCIALSHVDLIGEPGV